MPPFFDLLQLQDAITARAVPVLERLATSPNRLNNSLNNRFERDDPPPYVSSSESEEEEALHHPVLSRPREIVLEEYRDLLSRPLNDNETQNLVSSLNGIGIYTPGGRYRYEASREHDLLSSFYRSVNANSHANDLLKGTSGYQRRDVIVRRNIRKRWQRLGIWNPEWGIPGRVNRQPNDNLRSWKWKWQHTADPPPSDPRHPVNRAVQLRRNLAYGEYAPPPPRSRLRDDSSTSEAESFIISRPWFVWEVEKFEFRERQRRIPVEKRGRPNPGEDSLVTKWWKERGDWTPGWKWRHESPSPEPEDLTLLNTDDMDFTPSEVDALEVIPPTPPPKPTTFQPGLPETGGLFDGPWQSLPESPADLRQGFRVPQLMVLRKP
ncbi:253bb602-825c-4ac0-b4c1-7d26754dd4a3 [Thermothielavioides terrestris]|uniref:253bb602-825c-4ac0-b4c1-7d26754dd4a3 n=1 Tax=Thermothielavioides terrestris TaxID=2587410 RepID=A0A3S4AWY0_9PEZI|nr:253bb602-825c-4ac0-b4c1-7d26754dd4a3 [Thermothielavioides terrestris]